MLKKKPKNALNFRELARVTGADRASIAKWCEGISDKKQALEIIRERQKKKNDANVDPVSGLTWFQAKQKEEALRIRRQNEEAEKVKAEQWMATATHHKMVALLVNQLEQLAGKAKSQLGLSSEQAKELQRMVDEVRTNTADQVEQAKE